MSEFKPPASLLGRDDSHLTVQPIAMELTGRCDEPTGHSVVSEQRIFDGCLRRLFRSEQAVDRGRQADSRGRSINPAVLRKAHRLPEGSTRISIQFLPLAEHCRVKGAR